MTASLEYIDIFYMYSRGPFQPGKMPQLPPPPPPPPPVGGPALTLKILTLLELDYNRKLHDCVQPEHTSTADCSVIIQPNTKNNKKCGLDYIINKE